MSVADTAAIVVAALAMLAAVWVMARHGATLTGDKEAGWREKFEELEAAYTYTLRSMRDIERMCAEKQAGLEAQIKLLGGYIEDATIERKSKQLEMDDMRAEIAALRRALSKE